MKLSEAFQSNFLKADDLRGSPVTVTIASVGFEELGQGQKKESKIILGFQGKEKRMVCNKTNATTIGKLYGDETDGWIGQRITIMPREVEFQGEMVLAIRVSLQKPAPMGGAPAPRPQGPRTQEPPKEEYGHEHVDAPPDDGSEVPF